MKLNVTNIISNTSKPLKMPETISTAVTKKLGIKYPIMLAGMSGVSHGELAAAVSNAGGIGVIGGLTLSPKVLTKEIADLKEHLVDKSLPFGVDLAIPQIGGNARKTNHDYTHGHMPELIDIIIAEKAAIFVCAVGVPPKWIVDKLHAAGIPIMNMVGAPKHVDKALASGVDMICAQGTEAGGHCGEIGTMALLPQCIARCKGKVSPMDGSPIQVVAAGGIVDGQTMAAAFQLGASAVWVGTRFVASVESHAADRHKKAICDAGPLDTGRTLIYSGRPLRVYRNDYVKSWEDDRERNNQIHELCDKGIVPVNYDLEQYEKRDETPPLPQMITYLFGQGCGSISKIQPAAEIVEEMMTDCIANLKKSVQLISNL
mmetsp:Transcript_6485/g.7885  ORF Transcript_6485/g.7885 Transcript_6485/m.7885 type:complete len:373 (+) Transcript_6485:40-1158(+)